MENKLFPGRKKILAALGVFALLSAAALLAVFLYNKQTAAGQAGQEFSAATYAMDTLVTQQAYGATAQKAMQQVNAALAEYEERLSLFKQGSDIAKINAAAGRQAVKVAPETAALLAQAAALSAQSGGAFAVSVAPVTQAWGITTDHPRVVPQAELDTLLPLVDDSKITIEGDTVKLEQPGMGLDLGGIAKGAFCATAQKIYEKNGVQSAFISIGGNVYVKGTQPDGLQYRIGFRDPTRDDTSYIASFCMQDEVVAVSGGYERYFEQDGKRYIHIINPRTGRPAESDIVSVGVIDADGAVADFYSTTLFVWGKQRALQYMRGGGKAIVLDADNNLYVSAALKDSFMLHEDTAVRYSLQFVEAEGG